MRLIAVAVGVLTILSLLTLARILARSLLTIEVIRTESEHNYYIIPLPTSYMYQIWLFLSLLMQIGRGGCESEE